MSNLSQPVTPKPSATVMVVRPAANPAEVMEIFMLRRHSRSKFMPDRYVFPGGGLEAHDFEPETLALLKLESPEGTLFRDLPGEGAYNQVTPLTTAQEKGLFVATFHELFEEAGVLLALHKETGEPFELVEGSEEHHKYARYRDQLHAHEISFRDILTHENLLLDASRLIYYSHWITPLVEPIRYDTRFFVTLAQPDQIAESAYLETTHGLWISPRTALFRYEAGDFNLIFPTILHLRRLAIHDTIAGMLEVAHSKTVIPVSPDAIPSEVGLDFNLPGAIADRW